MNSIRKSLAAGAFVFAAALSFFAGRAEAQTTLVPGDITIIGYNSDAPDGFAFVTWKALAANTEIRFTDNTYNNNGGADTYLGTENTCTWTNGATPVNPGTVIVITDVSAANASADLGTCTGVLSGLSASNDNLFVYQTSLSNANVVFACTIGATSFLTSGATSSNTTYLPATLNNANGNWTPTSTSDNGQYTGARTSNTIAAHRAAIYDGTNKTVAGNWTFNDATNLTLDSTDFVISPPASVDDWTLMN